MLYTLLFLFSFPVSAADRISLDLDHDGLADELKLEHDPASDRHDSLRLQVRFGNGTTIENSSIVHMVGQGEELGVELEASKDGGLLVRELKDWGSSTWEKEIQLSYRSGALQITKFAFHWSYVARAGGCDHDLLAHTISVNGKPAKPSDWGTILFNSKTDLDEITRECFLKSGGA